jgi:hypothetical protein
MSFKPGPADDPNEAYAVAAAAGFCVTEVAVDSTAIFLPRTEARQAAD